MQTFSSKAGSEGTINGLSPFFMRLKKTHTVPMVTSYTAQELQLSGDQLLQGQASNIMQLQLYAASGDNAAYNEMLKEMKPSLKAANASTRSSKGQIYLTRNEGKTVEVSVAVQVKGSSLTWYFWAPGAFDQYPQEFRDKIYKQAALAHQKVADGCDLYYRGSNSFHVKMMHHHESESMHNHNHYRLKDGKHYDLNDFREHMMGFQDNPKIFEEFFEPSEIEEICAEFEKFHADWNERCTEDSLSKSEQYYSQETQRFNVGDIIEIYLFGHMQEPCRIQVDELALDYSNARSAIDAMIAQEIDRGEPDSDGKITMLQEEAIRTEQEYRALLAYRNDGEGSSRGLNAAEASARQIRGSLNPTIRVRQNMDDSLGKEVADIPLWAHRVKQRAESSHAALINMVDALKDAHPVDHGDVVHDWISRAPADQQEKISTLYDHFLSSPEDQTKKMGESSLSNRDRSGRPVSSLFRRLMMDVEGNNLRCHRSSEKK